MMTDKEKAAFREGIRNKVNIVNEKSRMANAKEEAATAKKRCNEILTSHQNKQMIRYIIWACNKLGIVPARLAQDFGFPSFLKHCNNEQLQVLEKDVKAKWRLKIENDKLK